MMMRGETHFILIHSTLREEAAAAATAAISAAINNSNEIKIIRRVMDIKKIFGGFVYSAIRTTNNQIIKIKSNKIH